MDLKIEYSGDELSEYLSSLKVKGEDLTPLGEIYGDIFRLDLKSRFISSPNTRQGGKVSGGKYWKPLSNYYLNMRPDGESGQIYIDSGRLRDSLTVKGNTEQISSFRQDVASKEYIFEFGTKVDYAADLQEEREILFMHPALEDKLVRATDAYLADEPFIPD